MQLPEIVGHVVGSRPPGLFSWLTSLMWAFGFVGLIVVRARPLRWGCIALIVTGLAGTGYDIYERGLSPPRPPLIVRMVSPTNGNTPVPLLVQLCATTPHGGPASVTDGSRWVLVLLDGHQVAESHSSVLSIQTRPGRHVLTVYLNSPYHQKYAPPIRFNRVVEVSATGSFPHVERCPR